VVSYRSVPSSQKLTHASNSFTFPSRYFSSICSHFFYIFRQTPSDLWDKHLCWQTLEVIGKRGGSEVLSFPPCLEFLSEIAVNVLELGSRNWHSVSATDCTIYTTMSLLLRSTVLCDLTIILSHTPPDIYRIFAQFWSDYEIMNAKNAFHYFLSRNIKICGRWRNIGPTLHILYKQVVTVVILINVKTYIK